MEGEYITKYETDKRLTKYEIDNMAFCVDDLTKRHFENDIFYQATDKRQHFVARVF